MTSAHHVTALAVALIAAILAIIGLAGWLRHPRVAFADRLILLGIAAATFALITGGVLLTTGRTPRDPLHVVYGFAALLVVPLARYLVRRSTIRRRLGVLGLAGAVVLGVWVRLVITA